MRAAVAITFIALGSPAVAREPLQRVPYVGCPADGQQGPQSAPKPRLGPSLPASRALLLSYYVAPEIADGLAILAPRGWHCLALYGSSGTILIVTPTKRKADDFFSDHPPSIRGPAIQVDVNYGGTSGRYAVAKAVARYFPTRRNFVREVVEMDHDIGAFAIEPLPTRSYPHDRILRRSSTYIRFKTPAHAKGEGTNSWLAADNNPIEGIRVLLKGAEEPDLYGVDIRLPQQLRSLTDVILLSAKGSD